MTGRLWGRWVEVEVHTGMTMGLRQSRVDACGKGSLTILFRSLMEVEERQKENEAPPSLPHSPLP